MIILIIAIILIFLGIIAGITIDDIRKVRIDNAIKKHPYARKWRQRPLVSIISSTQLDTETISILRKSYKKIEFVTSRKKAKGELTINILPDTIVDKCFLTAAIKQFNNDQTLQSVEVPSIITQPSTTMGLFKTYYSAVAAPFVSARSGIGINTRWTNMARTIILILNAFIFASSTYMAIALRQPDLLLIYITAFALWLMWAIARNPLFTRQQKLTYLLLVPSSLPFFALLAYVAIFLPAYRAPILITRRTVL